MVIESAGDNVGSLETLCAYGEDIVINFLAKNMGWKSPQKEKIKDYLMKIKNNPSYDLKIKSLKNAFSKIDIGFEHWRREQNKCVLSASVHRALKNFSWGELASPRLKNISRLADSKRTPVITKIWQ